MPDHNHRANLYLPEAVKNPTSVYTLLEPLTTAGLIVEPIEPDEYQMFLKLWEADKWHTPLLFQYNIMKPPSHPTFNVPPDYCQSDIVTIPLDSSIVKLFVYLETSEWLFHRWECMPGPCVDDVNLLCSSLGIAIQKAADFFLGQPSIIADWPIPVHRHPELDKEDITSALKNRQWLSASAFEELKKQRRRESDEWLDLSRWDRAMRSQYLKVDHPTDPECILYLRRDAQEAIIVK